jgi:NadR type nicotinamide-nucleotide adenylyltransferase
MTALPPTRGHLALIEFASLLPVDGVVVIVCTQPSEPFPHERYDAIAQATMNMKNVWVDHMHKEISQDASNPKFWDMWKNIMERRAFNSEDIIVSSEAYGQKVADLFGARFIPYDPARELQNIKATRVRKSLPDSFDQMIPEFQKYLTKTITVFGAESVGKTTVSRNLASSLHGHWRFEYARPYLEMVGAEVTDAKMYDIFNGQEALQKQARNLKDKPFVFQDTDLWSTIGYWEMWKGERAPADWYDRARSLNSDVYVIMSSEIPFEADPLRYGGNKRESEDQYWVDLCEREGLNYKVVHGTELEWRVIYAAIASDAVFYTDEVFALMNYHRKHNG